MTRACVCVLVGWLKASRLMLSVVLCSKCDFGLEMYAWTQSEGLDLKCDFQPTHRGHTYSGKSVLKTDPVFQVYKVPVC